MLEEKSGDQQYLFKIVCHSIQLMFRFLLGLVMWPLWITVPHFMSFYPVVVEKQEAILQQASWAAAESWVRGVAKTQDMSKTWLLQFRLLVFYCIGKVQYVSCILFLSVFSYKNVWMFLLWVHKHVSVSTVSEVTVHFRFLSTFYSRKSFPSTFSAPLPNALLTMMTDRQKIWHGSFLSVIFV